MGNEGHTRSRSARRATSELVAEGESGGSDRRGGLARALKVPGRNGMQNLTCAAGDGVDFDATEGMEVRGQRARRGWKRRAHCWCAIVYGSPRWGRGEWYQNTHSLPPSSLSPTLSLAQCSHLLPLNPTDSSSKQSTTPPCSSSTHTTPFPLYPTVNRKNHTPPHASALRAQSCSSPSLHGRLGGKTLPRRSLYGVVGSLREFYLCMRFWVIIWGRITSLRIF